MNGGRCAIEYSVLRVVPDIERAEFINVGVVLICRQKRFLDARTHLDRSRLTAFWPAMPDSTIALIEEHLRLVGRICAGDPAGGPIAKLGLGERWHWLASPASTIVQAGPVHTGLSLDPAAELDRLAKRLIASAPAP